MTIPPLDPPARQHDGTSDPEGEGPLDDAQTARLREENRALRELLAAQVQASIPRPGPLKRLGWWLISAPGAALVGWRSLVGRENATPITGKRVGYATLTVLYTLAIYGALVLLVVSWSTPDAGRAGVSAAGPVRVPLSAPPGVGPEAARPSEPPAPAAPIAPRSADTPETPRQPAGPDSAPTAPNPAPTGAAPTPHMQDVSAAGATAIPAAPAAPAREGAASHAAAPAMPRPTLRITEIPAENPHAWVDSLKAELARCATLGFFERPDCAWAARKQYCGPNQGWGAVKECPAQP